MPINRQWILRRRPAGEIVPEDLELVETETPELHDGEVLVRNIYLSLDPTHRIWMSDQDQYLPPVQIGEVMRGGAIGVVEQSRNAALPEGAIVNAGLGGWQDYAVVHEGMARRVPHLTDVPLTAHMSVLGATGLTAYFGLNDIGKPQPGETVVVSAAAGAVGSIVGQLAKLQGCRVIGIAGGAEKCRWLTQDLGFDAAIDYKSEDVAEALSRLAPNGVDINFENVGGKVMDAVIGHMNNFSRMPLCGMISTYNREGAIAGPTDFGRVLMHRILIKGFIVIDYLPRAAEAMAELEPLVAGGQLKWKVHVVDGLENAVTALGRLFTGDHDGKLLIQVSPEPRHA
ncbi:MAG: NADP-dependent oxidoreductase [Phenylobacterium sp.]|uniref:NADP-dependent oxidoreductase n=1 Tax=Phenylobacterium sp. TaxID=1871053 RepID=UPI0025E05DB2|nr:NADP-dependent oxidoreductase [Phenylobacterium sp.]MBA4011310.1 NADP-dependent oxidoreductase [Phenylobacterium sp.]